MFRIRSGVAMAVGLGLAAVTALVPASSFADSPKYVALLNGTSKNQQGPQDVLDIRGGSRDPGAEVICFLAGGASLSDSPSDNQLWELRVSGEKSDGADFVFIINKNSQLALTAPASGKAGDSVVQEPLSGNDNNGQEWLEFSPNGGNGIVFKNRQSGMVLDAAGVVPNVTTCGALNGGFAGGFAHVVEFPENDGLNQLWFFF